MVRNEKGVALAVAVFALVVIGGLVGGSFFLGTQEQRVGFNTLKHQQAFTAAQEGAQLQVANWGPGAHSRLAIGDSVAFNGTLSDGAGWYRGTVMRLNDMSYLVRSEGFSADSGSRHHTGLLVRVRPLEIQIDAALQTQGKLKIGGSAYISGSDAPPSGWSCDATEPAKPGISIPDEDDISTVGCGGYSCIHGDPKIEEDPTINDSSMTTFGDYVFDDLADKANKFIYGGNRKIQPSLVGGACDTSDPNNWGDPENPSAPCANYFPIIFSRGHLTVNGVQGQGVLLVDGDLSVQGNFRFYGPVVVKGTLKTEGTGGHFNGGVIAANVDLEQNTVLGNAVVNYSSCAVAKALINTAPGFLMGERSWINLY